MLDPATGIAKTAFGPQPNAAVLKLALAGNTLFADGNESICGAAHESVIAMPSGTARTPPVLWHNGGAPGCPFNSGDINASRRPRAPSTSAAT
jgi:hypothetical protein